MTALSTVHGQSKTAPEYKVWKAMRQRCNDTGCAAFPSYGGRGIRVCERWDSYAAFIEDMGRRPSPKHSIDRKDNDGNYEPGNCRWATQKEQTRNTRRNHRLTALGKTQCVQAWADETGINSAVLLWRIKRGWSAADAVSRPVRVQQQRGAA